MPGLKKAIFTLLVFFFAASLSAQVKSIGTPFIKNYARSNYQAGSQNWDIEQGKNGMMYIANNNGLLEYDGHFWKVYPLANFSIVRSIKSANDSTIYAGGFNEFGYYNIGVMGAVEYNSLTHLLSEAERDFGDVWNIFIHPDGIIFQTYTQIMFYKNGKLSVLPAPSSLHFSFIVNDEYYVNDRENGLMRYAMGKLYPLVGMEYLRGKEIWGMLSFENKLLIATASEGNFIYDGNSLQAWKNVSNDFLKQNQIYSCLRLSKELVAFGTIQNGMLICSNDGTPLQHINMEDGLQNNTVLCIGLDVFSNLWIGTDQGIDYVEINSPLSQLSDNYGLGAGYSARVYDDNLYLGTNQGVFVKSMASIAAGGFEAKEMRLIEETRGQVWTLKEINGSLFCGHNDGTFIIRGEKAEKITDVPGGWAYLKIPGDSTKIIGGTYSGLVIYHQQNGSWKYSKRIKGFSESSRILAFDDDGSLWTVHGYKGVFRVLLNDSYDSVVKADLYNDENSKLPTTDVSLAKVENEIIFTSTDGFYRFSETKNNFELNETYQKLFDNQVVRVIKQDDKGNFWYFNNNQTGVFRSREDGNYTRITLPFQKLEGSFNYSFELVYTDDNQNVFFGTENGFVHYNPSFSKDYDYQFKTFLRSMRTFNPDSVYSNLTKDSESAIELEYKNNDVEFLFSANDFENSNKTLYSTFLEGYDEVWSTWQLRNSRDLTNLDEGNYVFKVKAKNIYGTITEEAKIEFRVFPPFERSLIAFILYGLGFILLLVFFGWIMKKRFERAELRNQQKQKEEFLKKAEKLQRETLEAEKQVIRLRNEKLREEMKQKDKELANSTIQTLHKNEMLITLRDELKKLAAFSTNESHTHEVNHLVRKINKEIDNENQWRIFEIQFEKVHEEFLTRLKSAYPNLSPRELKLCAYLRMNITSKEISVLMNISTRGVEISRYRLRKKLNLTRETNLTDFILTF